MAFPSGSNWFRNTLAELMKAGATGTRRVEFDADTFRCALFTSSHPGTVNWDTDIGYGSNSWTTTYEVADGGGYTRPGVSCNTQGAPTLTVSSGTVVFDVGDALWAASTITAAGALLYDDTLTATNKCGIVTVDFAGNLSSSNGDFRVKWDATGVIRIS